MEPSLQTYQKMGALCLAWSYLEMETEKTLLGMLKIDVELSRIFVWRMGMRQRWQMLAKESDSFLQSKDVAIIRALDKKVTIAMRDRNIIIHGLVHAYLRTVPVGSSMPIEQAQPEDFTLPCWTIFMGEGAGKRYLVSTEAVSIVLDNVQTIGEQLLEFNTRLGFRQQIEINSSIEQNWPTKF